MATKSRVPMHIIRALKNEGLSNKQIAKLVGYTPQHIAWLFRVGRTNNRSSTGSLPKGTWRKRNTPKLINKDIAFLIKYDLGEFIRKSDLRIIGENNKAQRERIKHGNYE